MAAVRDIPCDQAADVPGGTPVTFHTRDWNQRFQAMGDQAEHIFEEVWPRGYTRTGLNRPPIQLHRLSLRTRYTPDYLTSYGYVEVQGFGRDRRLKIKHEKLSALNQWAGDDKVMFFLYDATTDTWATVDLDVMIAACDQHGEIGAYPEGKTFVAVHADHIPTYDGWHQIERTDS